MLYFTIIIIIIIIISAVRRFPVTRNSSNEILDSGKLLDSGTRIRVMKYSKFG